MWIYMITCYILSALTFLLVVTAFFQSLLKFQIFQAGHVTFMILTCILYLLTETLVIFFFVSTGIRIKEATAEGKLDSRFHHRSIALKRTVFPPLVLNMLFMIILFVLVGAVDTQHFPSWAYTIIFIGCIIHFVKTKITQNRGFRETTDILLEMFGTKQGE